MIRFEHVSKTYDGKDQAVNDVSFHIKPGEFVFIMGDSGSGKSTLIRLLLREINASEGKIIVNGKNIEQIKRRRIPEYRRNIGCVFQDFRLLSDRNVYENIAFAQRVIMTPKSVIKKKVPYMLSMVGLAHKYRALPKQLSGGEQQRVAIARALINEPKIILADEPTGNLDTNNGWEIIRLLDEINKRGTTVVVVTHNTEFAPIMKKRVIQINRGNIVKDEYNEG